ncbi:MAG TPA: double-strand break repair helicase AddA [Stellaceae bacterium]|nr:double-strand break repair helicase AddA [Stellaceae bacterium]
MTAPDPVSRQREAADVAASVWVAASAGTGKTKVLTDRVLALMLAGSAPARILCLTFTKAAAAEMANRLNQRLSRWTTEGDGALAQELAALTGAMPDDETLRRARRLFALVLDAPGGMRIETLHGFCQSLLRRFPIEADVAPHFEVMDERSAGEALADAREAVLSTARTGGDAALQAALAEVTRHVPEQGFDTLMTGLALERAQLARALDGGVERFSADLREALGVAPGTSEESILAAAGAPGRFDEPGLRRAAALMLESGTRDQECGERIADWLAAPPDLRAETFDDYLPAFFTQKGERRVDLMTKKLAAKAPEAAAALAAEADRLGRVVAARGAAALAAASAALVRLGGAVLDAYEQHKERRALLDYDDLVLKARDLLERPGVAPWVLFKLDGGLDHILIDEAQDTNPEQWQVVRALAEEFFVGVGARAERRTVFAVGDAKQSIYSFQRADPQAFLDMRDHFAARVKATRQSWRSVDLDISFRSTDAVLAAVDAVFARGEAQAGVALDGARIHHTPFRAGHAGLVEIWPPVEPDATAESQPWELPLEQRRVRAPQTRLAQAIAGTLRLWLDRGERLASRDRPVEAGDVMVLVRRRGAFVTELVRALKQAGVAVAGVDRLLLTDQLAVQDMMALGRFLLLPEDDLTLATVLKGPLCGLDDDQLFQLAYPRQGTLWSELRRRVGEHPLFAAAAEFLGALLARADFAPPYELFAEVLSARGGRRATLARLGDEAEDPLDEFLSLALAYERMHGPSLQGFLHWLATGETEVKRDLEQRGRNEVRVFTVHGAKGLQAPIVFLPDTLQVPRQTAPLLWTEAGMPLWRAHAGCVAPLIDRALAEAKARREAEYRRLLYVALTRAEDRLYICGWRNRQKPAEDCWYHLVERGLAAAPEAEPVEIDLGTDAWRGQGWRLATPQRARPDRTEALPRAAGLAEPLPEWALAPPEPEPTPPRPLAPSRPGTADPAVRSPLGVESGAGLLRGRLVHRLLQSLPTLAPGKRGAAARRFLALPAHGLDATQQEELAAETLAVLDHPEFAPLFAPGSQAEVPVVALLAGKALAGQIDRLVVTGESVMIVDYKTLRPPPLDESAVPAAYLDQLAAYRAAVAAIYPRREVRCALLWTEGPRLMAVSAALLDRHAP